LRTPYPVHGVGFTTHSDLRAALAALMATRQYDAVFMTAAVADYKPERAYEVLERKRDGNQEHWLVRDIQAGKIKSDHPSIAIVGQRTEKLIDLFRGDWKYKGLLVKFKLEVGIGPKELIAIGQASRRASGADYLVANTLDMVEGERAGAYLLGDAGEEWIARGKLAGRMAELARVHCAVE
jgi:phosphopantothenate-cysteine ligase/phosphopantothenoylcysteine decarboxylase/phosphopantothenate--cysteine ligase